MGPRECFLSILILGIMITYGSASRQYVEDDDKSDDDSDDDDSDEYRQFKRFLFGGTTTPLSSPSVIGNLIRPSTSYSPYVWPARTSTYSPYIWPDRTSTYSPWVTASGACTSNSCEHGGICIPKGQVTYDCKCVGPWRGLFCSYADACVKSPCLNGGTCLNVLDDYWCKCTDDYYGQNCQTRFSNAGNNNNNNNNNYCRPNICNTGRCVPLQTTYYCQCPADRYGANCENTLSSYYKRDSFKRRSFSQLLNKIKRGMNDQDNSDENNFDTSADDGFNNELYI